MAFNPLKPHNTLPDLPPPGDIETRAVLKACIEARAAMAELKASTARVPQRVLLNTIPLLEARASCALDGISVLPEQLFLCDGAKEMDPDPATSEALQCRLALWQALKWVQARPLNSSTPVRIYRLLLGEDVDVRTGAVNGTTAGYTPPQGVALLRAKLGNWDAFMHGGSRDSAALDPLVRMAIGHYQFAAIQPFAEANGRIGRLLSLLSLVEQGLLDLPLLDFSRHLPRNQAAYNGALLAVTSERAWEPWVLAMLGAVRDSASRTTRIIADLHTLMRSTAERMRAEAPQIYSPSLAELIFTHPCSRIGHLVEADLAHRQTASVYLKQLAAVGLLVEHRLGREKMFVNAGLLEMLQGE